MPTERRLRLEDCLPACPVRPSPVGGLLERLPAWKGRLVLDHGCGDAHRRRSVEALGATYVGLDPYSTSADLPCPGDAIPLASESVDAVISNAVLHLVPNPRADVREIGRVLKPGGWFIGYVGFLEGDPEQARFLFSHRALAETLEQAGLELEEISAGATGIDLQVGNLLVPFGTWPWGQRLVRRLVRGMIGAWMSLLSLAFGWRRARREGIPLKEARAQWRTWLRVSHAAGFEFTARKRGETDPVSGPAPFDWLGLLRCPRSGERVAPRSRDGVTFLTASDWPDASEWLVAIDESCAHPVRGRQSWLDAAHCHRPGSGATTKEGELR